MESGKCMHFTRAGKQVDVWPAAEANCPIIYLNTFGEEGEKVRQALSESRAPEHTLVAISKLEWDHDMAPWDIPPISEDDTPCTGGADDYLHLLSEGILQWVEKELPGPPSWRGLAGYSLAGLFAVYAMYHCLLFSRIASISGSLWFPDFKEYAETHAFCRKPEYLYLSLGDRESHTDNPYLKVVQSNTVELASFYREQGIETALRFNPGTHYVDGVPRTAKGIRWLLTR